MARFLGLLLLAFAAVLGLFTATSHAASGGPDPGWMYSNLVQCKNKNSALVDSIGKFCEGGMVSNSAKAIKGKKVKNMRARVKMRCPGGQYVPQDWCNAQFWDVCARGNNKGAGNRRYYLGCQDFRITVK